MKIIYLLEVCFFLLSCGLIAFIQSDDLSFFEIIFCAFVIEVTKTYFQRKARNGTQLRNGNQNFNFNNINDDIKQLPLVQSEAVYKFCLALDIKVQLARSQEKKVWIPRHKHQKLERKNKVPVVRSEIVHKMCIALGLEVEFITPC
ncbi:hypothetical protein TNIN_173521 [Trichonephila inaurata madagascariensis]|uniref:Uncharacterized protein n=1 Tax=Trichonephila inaurata madagascariensis TaxID=2747483 RepID=A0A8X7CQT4_9ARAC|nr:hypothetical protein TNIN_173521 [Trichonephila inaurata madagascariensis]